MSCNFNASQIKELVGLTEDFTAKVICPKIESYGITENEAEFKAAICATLSTTSSALEIGVTKYVKGKNRWYVDAVPEEEKPDEEKPGEKKPESENPGEEMADEISNLIERIIKAAKKHANGDAADFHATLASAALTILQFGGRGTKAAAMIALDGIISGKLKLD